MRSLVALVALVASDCKPLELAVGGDHHTLRARGAHDAASSPDAPRVILIALDGISRPLLYAMLRHDELPGFAALLGGDHYEHAYLDDTFLATMPSTTMAAWTTALTGVPPAQHGVTGNEYFIRETRTFACPAPVSFASTDPTVEIYTDDYLGKLIDAPTVYERIRTRDPSALIWISMSQVFHGADELMLVGRGVIGKAVEGYVDTAVNGRETDNRDVYATLDTSAVDAVVDRLGSGTIPDVLTIYLYGTDLYAHVAKEGPDIARRAYLREVVDPALAKLVARLRARGVLDRAWVVVTSDHGHTAVMADKLHALGGSDGAPPAVLRAAGFRVRKFARDAGDESFSAVLAYGGALAYVYVADRSTCPNAHDRCAWQLPPRYREDVLVAADAFYRANASDPRLSGTLDMVLTRQPRPYAEIDRPFEVYVGDGVTVPLGDYLATHPHPGYVDFAGRLRDLAVGRHGERAGDVLLVAHDGDRDVPENRYYFASPYHSWHGSPSRDDSEIPLVVANARRATAEIAPVVRRVLGATPYQQKLADLLVTLRTGAP